MADRVVSQFVRERDEGICPICHMREVDCCFHFITRAKYGTRWDVQYNLIGACSVCNDLHERDEKPAWAYFEQMHGSDAREELLRRSNRPEPHSREELVAIINGYSL